MNKIKKLLASLTALIMAVGLIVGGSVPVRAEGNANITITIDNVNDSVTQDNYQSYYTAYQIFKGDVAYISSGVNSIRNLSNIVAGSAISSTNNLVAALKANSTLNAKTSISALNESSTASDIAKAIEDASIDNNSNEAIELAKVLNSVKSGNGITATRLETSSDNKKQVKFENLDPGYYLVTSANGNKLILGITNIEVTEKNAYPSNTKTVVVGSNTNADSTTANIGDTVKYHINVNVPASADRAITVVDYISDGLTMTETANSITGTVTGVNGGAAFTSPDLTSATNNPWTAGTNTGTYTATWTKDSSSKYSLSGGNFQVAESGGTYTKYSVFIPEELVKAIAATALDSQQATFTLEYTAKLNQNAVIGDAGNPNKAHIEYGNYTTQDVGPNVYTYQFELIKVDADDRSIKLNSVAFQLQKAEGSADDGYTAQVNYYQNNVQENGKAFANNSVDYNTLYTNTNGKISFSGLAAGTYILTETQTVGGYNKLANPYIITVTKASNNTATIRAVEGTVGSNNKITPKTGAETQTLRDSDSNIIVDLIVENKKGSVLPSTGGIGTTVFYLAGGILIIGAAVLLIARGKRNA